MHSLFIHQLNPLLLLPLSFIGWRLSRDDLKYRTVGLDDIILYLFITLFYGNFRLENFFLSILIVITLHLLEMIFKKSLLAKTDMFLLFTTPFFIPPQFLGGFFVICGVLIAVFRFSIKDPFIPFAPAFFLSLLSAFIKQVPFSHFF